METWNKKDKFDPYFLILLFVIMSAGIIMVGYLYYSNHKTLLRAEVEKQLSSIGKLKANELMHWREDCLGDGGVFYKNAAFTALVRKYFDDPNDQDAQKQLRTWLSCFQTAYQYDGVFLLDNQYRKKIIVPDVPERPVSYVSQQSSEILQSGEIAFEDFYENQENERIYLKVLVPILNESDNRIIGVVALRIDPAKYLYPLINTWPVQNLSAETLLVRREGNNIRYLNELKFKQKTALSLVCFNQREQNPGGSTGGTGQGRYSRGHRLPRSACDSRRSCGAAFAVVFGQSNRFLRGFLADSPEVTWHNHFYRRPAGRNRGMFRACLEMAAAAFLQGKVSVGQRMEHNIRFNYGFDFDCWQRFQTQKSQQGLRGCPGRKTGGFCRQTLLWTGARDK